MSTDPNWQLPGERVTRRIASSASGAQLWVGCRVMLQNARDTVIGTVIGIPERPAVYVTVEWPDGTSGSYMPGRLVRIGTAHENQAHAATYLAELERKRGSDRAAADALISLPAVPPPPVVEHDRHYIQVAFDEPTVQLLSAVLADAIAAAAELDSVDCLPPSGRDDLQLTRRARAQLLYGYAQWLEGPA